MVVLHLIALSPLIKLQLELLLYPSVIRPYTLKAASIVLLIAYFAILTANYGTVNPPKNNGLAIERYRNDSVKTQILFSFASYYNILFLSRHKWGIPIFILCGFIHAMLIIWQKNHYFKALNKKWNINLWSWLWASGWAYSILLFMVNMVYMKIARPYELSPLFSTFT